MFGRNREAYVEPPVISPEEEAQLVSAALGRTETVDVLDGYKLPPDNDEFWEGPRKTKVPVTHTFEHPETREIHVGHQVLEGESRGFTNREVREVNIRSIAKGLGPLLIKWEDIELPAPRPTLFDRFRNMARNILQKADI